MADSGRDGSYNYLLNRWAPEKGLVTESGFRWMDDRVKEFQMSVGQMGMMRRKRAGTRRLLVSGRGGALGFARVSGGLEADVKVCVDTILRTFEGDLKKKILDVLCSQMLSFGVVYDDVTIEIASESCLRLNFSFTMQQKELGGAKKFWMGCGVRFHCVL